MPDANVIAAVFVCYLLIVLTIGAFAYRRTATLADYILGGRRLGKWVTGLSAQASDMSGWLLLGLPGLAYAVGLESLWMVGALALGSWLNWRLVARPLRRQTEALRNSLTLPDYLEARFDDHSRLLRVLAALFILFFFTFYVSSLLVAGGRLFEAVFGFPYHWAVGSGLAAILLYTFIGGFLAVSWTDAFQAALMIVALLAVATIGATSAGGGASLVAELRSVNPALLNPLSDRDGQPLGLITALSLAGWGLGYFGQPHILVRFMAIRDPSELDFARRLAVVWQVTCLAAAVLTALIGIVYIAPPLTGADQERVFIHLTQALFHPVAAGVVLSAILAAVMSTADSQLLAAASAVSSDFYKALLRPRAGDRELLWVGRFAVAAVAVGALLVALDPQSRVLDLVGYAWAGFGAVFGPVILLSLRWQRLGRRAAAAGMTAGGVTVIVWSRMQGGLFDLYELVPGFVAAAAVMAVLTLAGPASATTPRNNRGAAQ